MQRLTARPQSSLAVPQVRRANACLISRASHPPSAAGSGDVRPEADEDGSSISKSTHGNMGLPPEAVSQGEDSEVIVKAAEVYFNTMAIYYKLDSFGWVITYETRGDLPREPAQLLEYLKQLAGYDNDRKNRVLAFFYDRPPLPLPPPPDGFLSLVARFTQRTPQPAGPPDYCSVVWDKEVHKCMYDTNIVEFAASNATWWRIDIVS